MLLSEDADRARKIRAVVEIAKLRPVTLEGAKRDCDEDDRARTGAPVPVRSADNG